MTPYSHTIWTELTLLGSLITSAVTVHANMIDAFVDGKKKQNEFYFFIELQTIVTLHANLSIISIHARICTWQCGWIRIFYRKQESSCERNKQKTGDAHTHTHRPSRLTQAGKNSTSKEMVYSHTGHALSKKIIALCQQCIQSYRPCIACRQIDVVTMKQCKILRASRAAEPTDCWCSDRARICSTWSEQSSI